MIALSQLWKVGKLIQILLLQHLQVGKTIVFWLSQYWKVAVMIQNETLLTKKASSRRHILSPTQP